MQELRMTKDPAGEGRNWDDMRIGLSPVHANSSRKSSRPCSSVYLRAGAAKPDGTVRCEVKRCRTTLTGPNDVTNRLVERVGIHTTRPGSRSLLVLSDGGSHACI